MSQEKVDRHKKEKANRKSELRKLKLEKHLWRLAGLAVVAVLVVWLSYSGYSKYESSRPNESVEIDNTAISDYMNTLSSSSTSSN